MARKIARQPDARTLARAAVSGGIFDPAFANLIRGRGTEGLTSEVERVFAKAIIAHAKGERETLAAHLFLDLRNPGRRALGYRLANLAALLGGESGSWKDKFWRAAKLLPTLVPERPTRWTADQVVLFRPLPLTEEERENALDRFHALMRRLGLDDREARGFQRIVLKEMKRPADNDGRGIVREAARFFGWSAKNLFAAPDVKTSRRRPPRP
jgi:hypothetical protein